MSGCMGTEMKQGGHAVLHRASWLVPIVASPVSNGAVMVRNGTVLAFGRYSAVKAQCPAHTEEIDHGSSAILPALVNAHTHVELSALHGRIPLPQNGFPAWIERLFALRTRLSSGELEEGCRTGEDLLARGATGLYADITNGMNLSRTLHSAVPARVSFLEVLGFNIEDLDQAVPPHLLQHIEESDRGGGSCSSIAAHACYSTSESILKSAKDWTRSRRLPFSIHTAEHAEEIEFLREGTGFCRGLLERLGKWVPGWKPPGTTPVRYLDRLGILDSHTLLVHAVHMTEDDWEVVARRQCAVCFCPRSNRNLNVGLPDIRQAIRLGIPSALGTDSLAGNTDLDLFEEAAFVLDLYPEIHPEKVLYMMTQGGAQALHKTSLFGSIESGKRSALVAVSLPDSVPRSQLSETIIRKGREGAWRWASCPEVD